MPSKGRPIPADLGLRCLSCGYELTGLLVWICPECGTPFDPREVWLTLERSTWRYHFENRRAKSTYVLWMILPILFAAYFLLLWRIRLAWLGLFWILIGEAFISKTGIRPWRLRITIVLLAIGWGILMWRLKPLG